MKKLLTLVLAIAMLATMFTGIAAAEEEKIVLDIWLMAGNGDDYFMPLIDEYNAMSDKYFIKAEQVDYGTYNERMVAARGANTAPDISFDNFSDLAWGYKNGYYLPLNNLLSPEAIADLMDNMVEMCTFDGNLIAIAQHCEPAVLMYYNKQMFADAGIEKVPTTWAEMMDAASKLTSKYTYGVHFNRNWNLWSWQQGIGKHYPINEDWSAADCQDENYVAMTQAIADLYTSGYAPETELCYYDNTPDLLASDSCAITFCGSWGINAIQTKYPEIADNIGVAPAPTLNGEPFACTMGGWCFMIESTTESPEGCAEFLEWLLLDQSEEGIARSAGFNIARNFAKYTTRKSVAKYLEGVPIEDPNTKAWLDVVNAEIIPYCVAEPLYAWEISQAMIDATNEMIINKLSAEDALQKAADLINTFIQNNDYSKMKP